MLKSLLARATRSFGLEIRRHRRVFSSDRVSLAPRTPERGSVLLAYILEPFLRRPGEPISTRHTHHSESVLIADAWRELGFHVDVIDYRNVGFRPEKHYDCFVSARTNLESLAARLNADCVHIAHLDTSHYAFNNAASYARLRAAQDRCGVSLWESMRLVETNRAIERAHFGVVLGNDVTAQTYRYAGVPLFPLDVPTAVPLPLAATKNFDAVRRRFLFLSSGGMLHKGLDLVLEAFRRMPDLHLTVCGPVSREERFAEVYRRELYDTPNIRTLDWIDVAGPDFAHVVQDCIGVVYPSCAEGQSGAVVTCLGPGLIPIVSRESGLDVDGFGVTLADCSIGSLERAVRAVSEMAAEQLADGVRITRERSIERHSREAYARKYREIVRSILATRSVSSQDSTKPDQTSSS